jgi:ATP-dependent DNA ligase
LISRNGNPFNSFDSLRKDLTVPCSGRTVLDGEIVCLDRRGRPQFNDLLFHRGEPRFFAFDGRGKNPIPATATSPKGYDLRFQF